MAAHGSLYNWLTAQRRFVYMTVAALTVAGIWAATQLPSAIYPELRFSRVTVVIEGSTLGPRQVMFGITRPIEEAVATVAGVTRLQSRAIRGGSEVNITFAPSMNMTVALQQVQARVNQIRGALPPDLDVEIEQMTPSLFPILTYNLEGGDAVELYDFARYQIKPLFSRVPGVGRVEVQGSASREVEVVADPLRLAEQGMTFADLAAAIRAATTVTAVGRMPADYRQYLIVTTTEAHSPADIGAIVVGHGLHVRDLATVTMGAEDRVRLMVGDAKPAALINVSRHLGGNALAVADSVARIAESLRRDLPAGAVLKPVYDQASLVRDAVKSVRDAMAIGAVLAVIVLLFFLRHARVTAISAASIPITMAITVFVMSLIGQSFNLMTLGGMAIAIGIVIDDAVVITENIIRHAHLHPDRHAAIGEAIQELLWPVTTSTITTVVVFLPLGLLTGVEGQFFKALSITLTIAVLVSLVVALTIIPLLSDRFLRPVDVADEGEAPAPDALRRTSLPQRVLARVGERLGSLSDGYDRWLGRALSHPRRIIPAVIVLAALGIVVQRLAPTGFLPEIDEGAFVLDYWTPGGTALEETDRQVATIEHVLLSTPEIDGTSRRTAAEMGLFATEQNRGDIAVRLKSERDRDRSIFEVIDDVRDRLRVVVPRLRIEFVQILSDVLSDLAGNARPVEIKIFSTDLSAAERYAQRIEPSMSKIVGIEDYFSGVSEPNAEMEMNIDEAEANRVGMTPGQISASTAGALMGEPGGEIRVNDRTVPVRVRAPDALRFSAQRLGALPIVSSSNRAAIPLGALATFRATTSRAVLMRENQQQLIIATADLSERSLGAVMGDVQSVLTTNPPPAGVRVELGGAYASQQEAFRALVVVLGLAAASVVAVMVIQFQSFVEPFVILLAAPLSFVGAIGLLLVTGTPLNVSSFMGLILLVGLIVKNGIILLDFARHLARAKGLQLDVALREAARVRLRPILMTTLCTLFGLLPLALGLGAGSEMQRPLALAVIGGLALSTPITLFAVPTLLVLIRGRSYSL